MIGPPRVETAGLPINVHTQLGLLYTEIPSARRPGGGGGGGGGGEEREQSRKRSTEQQALTGKKGKV